MRTAQQWRNRVEVGPQDVDYSVVEGMLDDLEVLERQLEEADCVSCEKDELQYDLEQEVAKLEKRAVLAEGKLYRLLEAIERIIRS